MRNMIRSLCFAFVIISILSLSFAVGVSADKGNWSDAGKYDEGWLGDYNNTAEYNISNSAQMGAFLSAANNGKNFDGKIIRLAANIDMSENYWTTAFTFDNAFAGTFDGQGYIIQGLNIPSELPYGAFVLSNKGKISNLCMDVVSSSTCSSAIAIVNTGTIQNVAVRGSIGSEQSSAVGGVAYENTGTIENCYSVAQIKTAAGAEVGGICAQNRAILNVCLWSNVERGFNKAGTITNCEKITDKISLAAKLNNLAYTNGWYTWAQDTDMVFLGYPILTPQSVSDNSIPVNGISFPSRELKLYVGDETTISYTIYPENATNRALVWLSTNESVATVDENGNVRAVGAGFATIRATTDNGGKVANCFITVEADKNIIKSSSIKLDNVEYRIPIDKTAQIRYTILPEDTSLRGATFKVQDEKIVSCSENGILTPISAGSTVVTVTSLDGGCSVSALVSVIEDNYSMMWDGTASAAFGGGDGTKLNPYIIETGAQLAKLARDVNNGNSFEGVYFVQKISIMLNNTNVENWTDKLTTINKWIPIGKSSDKIFRGNYDGGGFAINGMYIEAGSDASGLFGYTADGSISNISIEDSLVLGSEFVGGIAGFNASIITGCDLSETSSIKGTKHVGGIAGYSKYIVNNCYNKAIIDGVENVGGIVGYSDNVIMNCSNVGKILGSTMTGGICGKSAYLVENCVNSAIVYGSKMCGGIAGYSELDVINCHCVVFPDATENAGLIVGYAQRPVSSYSLNTYATCGNLTNRDDYLIKVSSDSTYVLQKNGQSYIDELNKHIGCITTDNYHVWEISLENQIVLATYSINHNKISDGESSVKLSGSQIELSSNYTFNALSDEQINTLLTKANYSKLFQNSNISKESILFSRFVKSSSSSSLSCRLSLPFDFESLKQEHSDLKEYEIFSRIVFINMTDNDVFVYVPEYVNNVSEGKYIGALKCIYHSFDNTAIVKNGELSSRFTFICENNSVSFATSALGVWAVAEIGENENIQPIETGKAEITLPVEPEEEQSFDFSIVYVSVICVFLAFAALGIIVVVRSKNNLRIHSTDEQ